ncbi:MAG: hypothetical protein AAF456_18295, partial [Planctomycetota bacterium]
MIRQTLVAITIGLLLGIGTNELCAQNADIPGGVPVDPGTIGFDPGGNTGNNTNNNNTGNTNNNNTGTTGNTGTQDGSVDFGNMIDFDEIEFTPDERRNGFVGANTGNITPNESGVGFVGADGSQPFEGSFGGEAGTGGGGLGAGRGGFGAGQNQTFFSIQRSNIRARVTPAFRANRQPTTVTVGQFQNRLNRTPQTVGFGGGADNACHCCGSINHIDLNTP